MTTVITNSVDYLEELRKMLIPLIGAFVVKKDGINPYYNVVLSHPDKLHVNERPAIYAYSFDVGERVQSGACRIVQRVRFRLGIKKHALRPTYGYYRMIGILQSQFGPDWGKALYNITIDDVEYKNVRLVDLGVSHSEISNGVEVYYGSSDSQRLGGAQQSNLEFLVTLELDFTTELP